MSCDVPVQKQTIEQTFKDSCSSTWSSKQGHCCHLLLTSYRENSKLARFEWMTIICWRLSEKMENIRLPSPIGESHGNPRPNGNTEMGLTLNWHTKSSPPRAIGSSTTNKFQNNNNNTTVYVTRNSNQGSVHSHIRIQETIQETRNQEPWKKSTKQKKLTQKGGESLDKKNP